MNRKPGYVTALVAMLLGFSTAAWAQSGSWVLPSSALRAGLNGAEFHTDVRILNLGTSPVTVTATFYDQASGTTVPAPGFPVAGRSQASFDNVLQSLFGKTLASGSYGPIRFDSTGPLIVSSSVNNVKACGTEATSGQWLPGLDATKAMTAGAIPQLAVSTSTSAGYRTNLVVMNPGSANATATVKVRAGGGLLLSSGTIGPLGANGFSQVPLDSAEMFPGVAGRTDANLWVEFTSNQPVHAFASVINNASGDPFAVVATPAPAAAAFVPDAETKENLASALWLTEYDPAAIPPEILSRISGAINSADAFGERMRWQLSYLIANPDSFTPNYADLYNKLGNYATTLTPHQAYAMANLLGLDTSRGYQELPHAITFKFPQDDRPQFEYQVGWHFFVGSVFSEEGDEFGVQLMLWSYSMLPPSTAHSFGLSDIENQVTEMHFAITPAGGKHYRAKPTVVAGTTGLITYSSAPFKFTIGKNYLSSSLTDSLFPLELRARGVDRTETSPVEIEMDLFLNQAKGYVLQGDEGLAPSCGGVGTLYYSVPNLSLDPTLSWLKVNGQRFRLAKGKMWYDHQWGTGFMPSGNPRSEVLRAAQYAPFNKKAPGWDWMEVQFDDNTEIALSALHSPDLSRFYQQTGDVAPGTMIANANGLYIDQSGAYSKVSGKIMVAEWIKSTVSHDQYMATQTWYPNKVEITLDAGNLPDEKKSFSLVPIVKTGQQGFFAAGMQYSEGAVSVERNGNRIGRGFLESTGYADGIKQILRLAGLPETAEMTRILDTKEPSADLIKQSTQFLAIPENTLRLIKEVSACRGL